MDAGLFPKQVVQYVRTGCIHFENDQAWPAGSQICIHIHIQRLPTNEIWDHPVLEAVCNAIHQYAVSDHPDEGFGCLALDARFCVIQVFLLVDIILIGLFSSYKKLQTHSITRPAPQE